MAIEISRPYKKSCLSVSKGYGCCHLFSEQCNPIHLVSFLLKIIEYESTKAITKQEKKTTSKNVARE